MQTNPRYSPECPVCQHQLDSLGSSNLIKPFWLRFREFFLYPLYPSPVLVMLALAVLAFLMRMVPGWQYNISLTGFELPRNFLFVVPFMLLFFRYAQTVLEDTAHGHLKPLQLSSERLLDNGVSVIKLFTLMLVFYLLKWTALDLFNEPGYYLLALLTSVATPAAVMILSMEDRFFSALNPLTIFSVISRIGTPYFILFMLFILLEIAQNYLLDLLLRFIDPSLSIAVFALVSMYFYLIMFNMMGYLLYQHHDVLGFTIEVEMHEQEGEKQFDTVSVSPEMRAVEILIHEGKLDQAVRQLTGIISANPGDLVARDRMLKLLRLMGNTELHRSQLQNYISYMVGENNLGAAARLYQTGSEYDRDFRPSRPSERIDIAQYFRQKNQYRLALAVLNDLHRDFPSFESIPQAYLMVASILCEQYNDDERAIQILSFLVKNYPDHPLRGDVDDYLRIVQGLSNG